VTETHPIEIVAFPTSDRAYADSPEGAIAAARALLKDATETVPRGKDSYVQFFNQDGKLIAKRSHV
jgi:hypothetical protein